MNPEKEKPTIRPGEDASPRELVAQALTDDEILEDVKVSMWVAGGMPSQRYSFDFEADGSGKAHCVLDCKVSKRKGEARDVKLDRGRFRALLKEIHKSNVLAESPEEPRFLPDTVVGCLEVRAGNWVYRTYFAADPEQAKVQKKVPSKALTKAVDAVYTYGGRLIRKRLVKP